MSLSYWEKTTYFNNLDVAIIGSGIVGLNAALKLKKKHKHLNIIVLERGPLPSGASSKNAGFACFGSASELLSDLQNTSESETFTLVEKRWKGLLRLRKNLGDKAISNNFDLDIELALAPVATAQKAKAQTKKKATMKK